jgi:sugar/nucleoside kinase (ribokinase family)
LTVEKWLGKYLGIKNTKHHNRIKCIITNGPHNITLIESETSIREIKVPKVDKIVKATGAGDCFSGTFLSMMLRGKNEDEALLYARAASKVNLESKFGETPISDNINMSNLEKVVSSGIKDLLV